MGNQDEAESCSGPCLAIFHGEEPLLTLYDVSQQKHQTKDSGEFANKRVFGSCGDWFLGEDVNGNQNVCLMNAMTMQKYQLPHDDCIDSRSFFHLSGSPADDCSIHIITSHNVLCCKIGATTQELTYPIMSDATIFQGSIYYVCSSYCLYRTTACLEDSSSPMRFEECIDGSELVDQQTFYEQFSHLVGSCDKLLYIMGRRLDMGVADFEVLGADLDGKVWEKVYNIPGTIFWDTCGAFFTPLLPEWGLQVNCIYYMPPYELEYEDPDNLTMMAYDLGDQCVAMLPPLPFKLYGRTRNQNGHQLRWFNHQI